MITSATPVLSFDPLDSGLRRVLESSVVEARGVVEAGVGKVFGRLGVARSGVSDRVPEHLSAGERVLRRVVLAKRHQAGSVDAAIEEVGFGVWHRMLFTRFLAENRLLIHPDLDVAVSLDECEELAAEEGVDGWVLASRFAAEMLPGLFPQDDPLARIELLPEDLAALEALIEGLPTEVFTSDDGLGWVYQFWQSEAKDQVNASEVKIGARELPAVTQLFTEHYMVRFLLENSLGAWWAARHPNSPLLEAFEYLRFTDDGQPVAGTFEGWPETVAEVTVMDPCCGSGHFLTAAFEMLWRMRAEEEHLTPAEAQDAVIQDNLFGLELDPRCTQIAAFNLALTAWKAGGYRQLPLPNIACSGIRVAGSLDEWLRLAGDDLRLQAGLEALHDQFKDADTLGSLVNPRRATQDGTLTAIDFDQLEPLLNQALTKETAFDPAAAVFGQQAEAIAHAATLLASSYTLITTNPPFLARQFQDEALRGFLDAVHEPAKADLATSMLDSWMSRADRGGSVAFVTPQNWMFLGSYSDFRSAVLSSNSLNVAARLGAGAFEAISGEVVQVALTCLTTTPNLAHEVALIDTIEARTARAKDSTLATGEILLRAQHDLMSGPGSVITFSAASDFDLLDQLADSYQGLITGDNAQFLRQFWEIVGGTPGWAKAQVTPDATDLFRGRDQVIAWSPSRRNAPRGDLARIQGLQGWDRKGVVVSRVGGLPASLYTGEIFVDKSAAVVPRDQELFCALWAYTSSDQYQRDVRAVDPALAVASGTLVKVPFDVEYWRKVAEKRYPGGLPEPWSDDPTQWLFLGDPAEATDPLQVAVARMLGYSWPDQQPDRLDMLADEDGIVCVPAVSGERPAADRLRELLVAAFEPDDPTGLIDGLLSEADADGKSLDWWLRERFFKQHCKLFHNRPFIWHIWDGRKDGFSALVNYHRLDNATLKKLAYSYLGWWIERQKGQVREEKAGAEARLAAALDLQDKLELILEGEPPFDVFVRWKELWEQPIGWEPDLNDGVRLNVRPFVAAGVLRSKFSVQWKKDRGKNPEGSERLNDLHNTRTEKQTARQQHEDQQ